MLERIKAGKGRLKDLDLLLEIGDTIGIIPGTTICGLSDGARLADQERASASSAASSKSTSSGPIPTGYMVNTRCRVPIWRAEPSQWRWTLRAKRKRSRLCRSRHRSMEHRSASMAGGQSG